MPPYNSILTLYRVSCFNTIRMVFSDTVTAVHFAKKNEFNILDKHFEPKRDFTALLSFLEEI